MFKKSRFSVFGVLILGVVILASPVFAQFDHDVGVLDLWWPEEPDEPPDHYGLGQSITVTVTVENFGNHTEYDIPVRLEVREYHTNTMHWQNIQLISFLDWSGNGEGNPYIVHVEFPTYTLLYEEVIFVCCTELETDEYRANDTCKRFINYANLKEDDELATDFHLESLLEPYGFQFSTPHQTWVKLDVFDVDGRWVKSLENDIYEPGSHAVAWDGRDNAGRKTSTGVYFVRIQADEFADACKVVVIN